MSAEDMSNEVEKESFEALVLMALGGLEIMNVC